MTTVTRRNVLKGGTALAGGMAGILATGRAPAFAQGTTVHWLRWNDFVPASDQLLRKEMLPAAEKALGIKINFETVNANDLQPRITSAIQSGSGPDLIMLINNHPQLYAASVRRPDRRRRSDRARPKAATTRCANRTRTTARSGSSMPWAIIGGMIAYRKSWFDEVGATAFPDTWEKYREVGKKLKAKGRPIGQTLGHTFGDAPTFSYPYLWSWGGKEVEKNGKVVINRKETVEFGQVHDRPSGRKPMTRAALPGTTPTTTARSCRRPICGHTQRRLDLHRVAAQSRQVHHREGRAAENRHPARAVAQGPGRAVRHAHLLTRTCCRTTRRTRPARRSS